MEPVLVVDPFSTFFESDGSFWMYPVSRGIFSLSKRKKEKSSSSARRVSWMFLYFVLYFTCCTGTPCVTCSRCVVNCYIWSQYLFLFTVNSTRVHLGGEGSDSYINASHIRVPVGNDNYHYIATQVTFLVCYLTYIIPWQIWSNTVIPWTPTPPLVGCSFIECS